MKLFRNIWNCILSWRQSSTAAPTPAVQQPKRKKYFTADEIHRQYYSEIPIDVYSKIIQADPSYSFEKPDKLGKYAKWLLSLYIKNKLKIEDLYKATEYLCAFSRFRTRLISSHDIMQYHSLPELYDAVKDFLAQPQSPSKSKAELEKEIKKNEAKRLYEDDEWIAIQPLTRDAAIIYGRNTQWCTAATSSYNYFDYYNSRGPLYILISKKDGRKYQLHIPTKTCCDETDEDLELPIAETIGFSIGLAEFFQGVPDGIALFYRPFTCSYFSAITLSDGEYVVNWNGVLMTHTPYDELDFLEFKRVIVKKDGLYNILSFEFEPEFAKWSKSYAVVTYGVLKFEVDGAYDYYLYDKHMWLRDYVSSPRTSYTNVIDQLKTCLHDFNQAYKSEIDNAVYSIADSPADYTAYLRLFGLSANHRKGALYHMAIPILQAVSLFVFFCSVVGMIVGFGFDFETLGHASALAAILSVLIILIFEFSSKLKENFRSLMVFLTVNAIGLYALVEYGPMGLFISLAAILVLFAAISKAWRLFKSKMQRNP